MNANSTEQSVDVAGQQAMRRAHAGANALFNPRIAVTPASDCQRHVGSGHPVLDATVEIVKGDADGQVTLHAEIEIARVVFVHAL